MVETPEPSDQQPEEGPSEQVFEDEQHSGQASSDKEGEASGEGSKSRDAGGQATGEPKSAG